MKKSLETWFEKVFHYLHCNPIHVLIYLDLKEADKFNAILECNNTSISLDSINNNDVPSVSAKCFTILD